MLAAVNGYFDGTQIVINDDDRKNFSIGDELIITILDKMSTPKKETRAEKRRRLIASNAFVVPTQRSSEEIDKYIREMRDDDRLYIPSAQECVNRKCEKTFIKRYLDIR